MKIEVFTSINSNYIDKAATLWDSLTAQNFDLHINTFLIEPSFSVEETEVLRNSFENTTFPGKIHTLCDLSEDWELILKNKSIVEACTVVKASATNYLLEQGADVVVYFDPDILLFAPIDELILEVSQNHVSLTPHLLTPPDDDHGVIANEIEGSMKYGIFNLGFFAFANSPEAKEVLSWWNSRLTKYCEEKSEMAIFTDQKWFDLSQAYFPQVIALRNPGYNVAPWNIASRKLKLSDGVYYSESVPLTFFHFSSFDTPALLTMLEHFDRSKISLKLLDLYTKLVSEKSPLKAEILSKHQSDNLKEFKSIDNHYDLILWNKISIFAKRFLPTWLKRILRYFLSKARP